MNLHQRNGSAQALAVRLSALVLVGQLLDPSVGAFDPSRHLTELVPDDLVLDVSHVERLSLPRPLDGLLKANSGVPVGLRPENEPLVIEVLPTRCIVRRER